MKFIWKDETSTREIFFYVEYVQMDGCSNNINTIDISYNWTFSHIYEFFLHVKESSSIEFQSDHVSLLVQARAFRSRRCQKNLANLKAQQNMVKASPTK
jgi:hypothetical protein